jgi:hypothetical protein
MKGQTLTEALDRHIKLIHAIQPHVKREEVEATPEEDPAPPTAALPLPTRRRRKKTVSTPLPTPQRRLVRKRSS